MKCEYLTVLPQDHFIIYINDIFSVNSDDDSIIISYADDTAVLYLSNNWNKGKI